ncbi:uncharacterized protein LOC122511090 [Leptopilina heterotoma]|uniref:uncharacterized protein LOC122511090 n=1 Tax=Leptopilina heterotoma TaxID=63436 RepID=UPI001CA98696|nr:uncharacterized protein LOC122511090 [Leptopilina heterotoma]
MHTNCKMSQRNNYRLEDLRRLEQALKTASAYMTNYARHEDTAIFIGSTRSGKSSLINYLIGNKLIGKKVAICKPVALIKADTSPGPQIGIGSTSETAIPSRWDSKSLSGLGIWDAPGFDDNRGVVQDITNAFYINELFKNIKSARIVLVTDINDIANDSIRPFLSLLNSVERILKEKMRDCFSSVAVIFTKVPDSLHDNRVDKKFINELLKEQFLSSSAIDISEAAKEFIRHLIKNNQNIGFFKKAAAGNVTEPAIDDCITDAIKSTSGVDEKILKQVSPSISEGSKVFLFEVREQLSSMKEFNQLQKLVGSIFGNKLNEFEIMKQDGVSCERLIDINQELFIIKEQFKKVLRSTTNLHSKILTIEKIDSSIENFIVNKNLLQKAKFMEFVDQLLDLKESRHFDFNLHGIILTAMTKVEELIIWVKLQLGEMTRKEAEEELYRSKKNYEVEINQLKTEVKCAKVHNNKVRIELGPLARAGATVDDLIKVIGLFFSKFKIKFR